MNYPLPLCLLLLTVCITGFDLSPFTYQQTLAQCTKHFELTRDFSFAICGNQISNNVLKWNSETSSFEFFQEIVQYLYYMPKISITPDGMMVIFVNSDNATASVYYRNSLEERFELIHQMFATKFYISDNHQFLTIPGTPGYIYSFNEQNKKFEMFQQLPYSRGQSPVISNDGSMIVSTNAGFQLQIFHKVTAQDSYTLLKLSAKHYFQSFSVQQN